MSAPGWGLWLHAVRPVPELVDLAVHAERQGASVVLVADEGTDRDVYVVLAAIAAATSTVTLVPGVTNPHSRHPVATAAALASLEELAPGRVVAGLGAGGTLVFGPMGLRPPRPYTALREAVEVIDTLLAGEPVAHDGEFSAHAQLPWSPRRLPLALAGRGPRAQQLALTRSDWLLVAGKPVADLPAFSAELRRTRPRTRLVWNPAAAWHPAHREVMRAHLSYMAVDMPPAWRERFGVGADVVREIARALSAGGPELAGPLVPDGLLDAFALTGSRASVVARLADVLAAAEPDLLVFDLHDYTREYVAEIAAVVEGARQPALAQAIR